MDIDFHNTAKPLQNNHEARLGIDARASAKTSIDHERRHRAGCYPTQKG
jgi:hypothetical protein